MTAIHEAAKQEGLRRMGPLVQNTAPMLITAFSDTFAEGAEWAWWVTDAQIDEAVAQIRNLRDTSESDDEIRAEVRTVLAALGRV